MTAAEDRARGVLLGLAAGDRNGGPLQMAIRVAASLIARRGVDIEDIAARYLDWWRAGAFDTGPTAARVLALVDAAGMPFCKAAERVHRETRGYTAGCNPAHRSAPMAMLRNAGTDQLARLAREEAALTHAHPLSGDVAAAVVVLCSELVRGRSWDDAVASASAGRLPETQAAMRSRNVESLNDGGFAPDVLAAALYFVGTGDSFENSLVASLRFAGPANYCPVLVGSIGGAKWGASAVSGNLLDHCQDLPSVRTLAATLASQ